MAQAAAVRAALTEEHVAGGVPLRRSWWQLIEVAPETLARTLPNIEAIADEEASPRWVETLEHVLQALTDAQCESLLDLGAPSLLVAGMPIASAGSANRQRWRFRLPPS